MTAEHRYESLPDCHGGRTQKTSREGPTMTTPEPTDETDDVLTTPATPGAQALPTTGDDGSDE